MAVQFYTGIVPDGSSEVGVRLVFSNLMCSKSWQNLFNWPSTPQFGQPSKVRLRVGPRALSGKKRIREQGVNNFLCQSVCLERSKGQ
jgi:hypothetical protein